MKKIIAGIILTLFAFTLVTPIVEAKVSKGHHTSKKYVHSYVKKNGKVVKGHTKTVHKGSRR